MIEEDGGDWEENLPWARRVYLSSIHSALQSKSVGLSPAEAFRGWAVPRAIDVQLDSGESPNPGEEDLDRVVRLKDKLDKAARWSRESRLDYERAMKDTRRNKHRRKRVFEEGDKVRVYKPPGSKKERKVGRTFVGPFIIEKVVRHGGVPSEYVVRREGGRKAGDSNRVTAEQIRSYVDSRTVTSSIEERKRLMEIDASSSREWEGERILDESESIKGGDNQYWS